MRGMFGWKRYFVILIEGNCYLIFKCEELVTIFISNCLGWYNKDLVSGHVVFQACFSNDKIGRGYY